MVWVSSAFEPSNIRAVASRSVPEPLQFYIDQFDRSDSSLQEVYDELYLILREFYRNEYVFKNEVINRIYGQRHDVEIANTLCEFRTGNSRIDLAVFNGTSTGYEIKTEIDNLDRLVKQCDDYALLFERVFVITTESKIDAVTEYLENHIGIIILDEYGDMVTVREASSNFCRMSQRVMFECLRKDEHYNISKKYDANVSELGIVEGYFRSKEIFCSLCIEDAHEELMDALSNRKTNKSRQILDSLPDSLASAYFSTKMSPNGWSNFLKAIA